VFEWFGPLKIKVMIEMFKVLKEEFKLNPIEVITNSLFVLGLFTAFYIAMWVFV
jgi:hypothetical protein